MPISSPRSPRWIKPVLLAAALYNVLWGGLTILFPNLLFDLAGMTRPNYPELWQCIGMIVGVYGVGYAIAAYNSRTHWPIVLVGLLGKLLGPLGFGWAILQNRFPWHFGWTIVTNDLIWWLPFTLILADAFRAWRIAGGGFVAPSKEDWTLGLQHATTQTGENLLELSQLAPTLVVFMRHFGCTFCREGMADLSKRLPRLHAAGIQTVVVHMEDSAPEKRSTAETLAFFTLYGLQNVLRIADPEAKLYKLFGLRRGSLGQLFGLKVWIRGWQAGVLKGYGVGPLVGDGFRMPGLFVLHKGQIVQSYVHRSAADRPDVLEVCGLI